MPSSVRPKGSSGAGRGPPAPPMSERQQMALLMQMTSTASDPGRASSSSGGSRGSGGAQRDRNERGETPLHLAAIKGDVEQVSKLLAHRADPNAADFAGWTPLHEACNHGFYEVTLKLLNAGAVVNARGLDNDTPLHDAAAHGHLKLIKLLVERGADIHAKNSKGKTPLDVAHPSSLPYLNNPSLPLPDSSGSRSHSSRSRSDDSKKHSSNSSSSSLPTVISSNSPADTSTTSSTVKELSDMPSDKATITQSTHSDTGGSKNENEPGIEVSAVVAGITQTVDKQNATDDNAVSTDPNVEQSTSVKAAVLTTTDSSEVLSGNASSSSSSSTKRGYSEVLGNDMPNQSEDSTTADEEVKRKKRKEGNCTADSQTYSGTSTSKSGQTRNQNQGKSSQTSSGAKTSSSASGSDTGSSATKNSSAGTESLSQDSTTTSTTDLKVPPLKIVIPQNSTLSSNVASLGGNDGDPTNDRNSNLGSGSSFSGSSSQSGSNRNGKNSTQRSHHTQLPYVLNPSDTSDKDTPSNAASVSSNSGSADANGGTGASSTYSTGTKGDDIKKDKDNAITGDDQKPQRVLRSSSQRSGGGHGQTSDRGTQNLSPLQHFPSSPIPNSPMGSSSGSAQSNTDSKVTANSPTLSSAPSTSLSTVTDATTESSPKGEESVVQSPPTNPDATTGLSSSSTTGPSLPVTANSRPGSPTTYAPSSVVSNVSASELPSSGQPISTTAAVTVMTSSTTTSSAATSSSSTSTTSCTTSSTTTSATATASSSSCSSGSSAVELHPRKRKIRPNKDQVTAHSSTQQQSTESSVDAGQSSESTSVSTHHHQPQANCYQMFLDIRKQIEKRRCGLFPVQPKPPQGFKDYLMNRCTYVLASNTPTTPNITYPATLPSQMKDLFAEQEKERYRLRMQHVIEKEKLVLAVEQEILRVHGRAARALANQSLPFSACTILKDEEVYNLITPEQEEKDRNARSRYNGRLFLSWLQDVDDKWEKIKEHMLLRHHNEAESLRAVQKMDWEWKLKEMSLCDRKTTPSIDELHVPMVHVSDDFDLLPTLEI